MKNVLKTNNLHTFHIPVMGLAYTIDSPIRVAQYGISSVISIMDDDLIEKMNAFYSKKFDLPYQEISQKISDYRAKRITSYLNTVDKIVTEKFENFKTELSESKAALENYISMLPNKSEIRKGLENFIQEGCVIKENIKNYLEKNLFPGDIDINIMTKVDKDNFEKSTQLPLEFNDAHAALRGFANSTLTSSVVLSAGMNPRLYSYFETFPDFFPDQDFHLKKKIILKVSDFRSALVQGNFLAKKGLWVSEYRIESGLNCGGHAFATEGHLLGPILEEFKQKKENLLMSAHDLLCKALLQKNLPVPETPLNLKITVQGGVGTAEEHEFLLDFYKTDSVGWGSPFLLVPEATSSDNETRELLAKAKEEDLYLSNISPLGVPFNTVRGTTNEILREKRIRENKAGSSCPKKYLALSKQYDEKGICTASRKYQEIKLDELQSERGYLTEREFVKKQNAITEKSCLCIGLANASLLENNIKIKGEAQGVVVCPGPNIAYFNRQYSLSEMVQHIYGYKSVLNNVTRPNMFVKELSLYLKYFKNEVQDFFETENLAQQKKLTNFRENLLVGIEYYSKLFANGRYFHTDKESIQSELNKYKMELETIEIGLLV